MFYDGLAFDEINHLYDQKKNSAVFYKITTDFFRQSGALHEIYLTGKFSRNFVASKTSTDNLIYQLNHTNYFLKFVGSQYPLFELGGGRSSESENFFTDNFLERDKFPFSILCPGFSESVFYPIDFGYNLESDFNRLDFDKKKLMDNLDNLYSSKLSKENINSCFERAEITSSHKKNLIYYTQIIDSFNHGYSKEHPRAFAVCYAVTQGILKIMEWIDDNPDYALALLSDHGGQAYLGEDNYCNHGCLNPGNEGVLMIYMKNFDKIKPIQMKAPEILKTFDVASIISQILENINIPLESTGKIVKIVEKSKII